MKSFNVSARTHSIVRLFLLKCCTVVVYTVSPLALLHAQELQTPQIKHYHAETPESLQAARASLDQHIKEIEPLLTSDSVDVAALEQVHQISYSLEAATKVLLDGQDSSALQTVSEAVEGLHLASEARNVEECRSWLKQLQLAHARLKSKHSE